MPAAPPVVVSVSPGSGASLNQTFSYVFSDGDGWTNLFKFEMLINSALDGRDACFFTYFPGTSTLYLVRDDGAQYDPMVLGGSPPQLQNSQCIIYNAGTSATGSGAQFTLNVKITFKPLNSIFPGKSFWGHRAMYMAALDNNGGNTGHRPMGVHEVPRPDSVSPPQLQVLSVEPGQSNTAALADQQIQVVYQTPTPSTGAQILLNAGAVDGRNACYVTWTPGELHLVDDNGGPGYQDIPLGGSVSKSNNQCTVHAAGSSAIQTGEYFILTVRLVAKSGFAGPKLGYLATQSASGNTGWQPVGVWNIGVLPDNIQPTLSTPVVTVTSSSARFEWVTNEPTKSQVFVTNGPASPFNQTLQVTHSATVTGLAAGTTYSFQAYSPDQFNNANSAFGQFRTSDPVPVVSDARTVNPTFTRGWRWEAAGAAGFANGIESWVHGWFDFDAVQSYVSNWNGSGWAAPSPIALPPAPPDGARPPLLDLNVAWDPMMNRFVYVAINQASPGGVGASVYFGKSSDPAGSQWTAPAKVFEGSTTTNWDYPSVAVSANGMILVGAVNIVGSGQSASVAGYFAKEIDGSNPGIVIPEQLPALEPKQGQGGRVVATNTDFRAFIHGLDSLNRPVRLDHWAKISGGGWIKQASVAVFDPPRSQSNDSPTSQNPATYFSTLALAAQGDPSTNGKWAVAFQVDIFGRNNIMVCTEDRGCGRPNPVPWHQFLPSVSIARGTSASPTYWAAYLTIPQADPTQPHKVDMHSFVFPPNLNGIGKVVETGIDPRGFRNHGSRCTLPGPPPPPPPTTIDPCHAAGDFMTMAALMNSSQVAKTSVPFLQGRRREESTDPDGNDLMQAFVQYAGGGNAPETPPGTDTWIWVPLGVDLRGLGRAHSQVPPSPAQRSEWFRTGRSLTQ